MTPAEQLKQVANECVEALGFVPSNATLAELRGAIELGHCYQNDASFDFALRVYFLATGVDIYGD